MWGALEVWGTINKQLAANNVCDVDLPNFSGPGGQGVT